MTNDCTTEGCSKPAHSRGFCAACYARFRRQGLLPRKNRQYDRNVPRPGPNGYLVIYRPEHPNAYRNGIIAFHRLVMSEHLARALRSDESVHHKNGDKADCRIKNLELRRAYHGKGVTVEDAIADAVEVLRIYAPEMLAERRLRAVA